MKCSVALAVKWGAQMRLFGAVLMVVFIVGAAFAFELTQPPFAVELEPAKGPTTRDVPAQLDLSTLEQRLFPPKAAATPIFTPRALLPPFRLLGTMVSDGRLSLAVVQWPNRQTTTLTVDSAIEGWQVAHIEHRCVLLARGAEHSRVCAEAEPSTGTPSTRPSGDARRISRAEIERVISERGPALLQQVHALPKLEHGQLVGFALRFNEGHELTALGLKPNDVITHLDGAPVSIERVSALALEWRQRRGLTVGLLRAGAATTMQLELH